ncbi:MAG TPA: hypothetical protein VFV77_01660 [Gammaproteobacteria bacterium]|nr:hypothetical protein [Gammaproteobacteria bacterium]
MSRRVESPEGFLLRDLREAGWFWIQNELIDLFAPLVGPYAVCVYICLCRHSEGRHTTASLSTREIEHIWAARIGRPALSRSSVHRAIRQLVAAGMVRVLSEAGRGRPATYGLVSLPKLARTLTEEQKDHLATMLENTRNRVEDAQPVPEGDTENLLKTSGKACVKDGLSTEIPGTLPSPTGTKLSPTGTASIKKKGIKNKPSPTPPTGRGVFDFSVENPKNKPTQGEPHAQA